MRRCKFDFVDEKDCVYTVYRPQVMRIAWLHRVRLRTCIVIGLAHCALFIYLICYYYSSVPEEFQFPYEVIPSCNQEVNNLETTDLQEAIGVLEWEIFFPPACAFLFENTTFYPPNTVVLLFDGKPDFGNAVGFLPFSAEQKTGDRRNFSLKVEPASWRRQSPLAWEAFRAIGQMPKHSILTHVDLRSVEFRLDTSAISFELRRPSETPRDFVTCLPVIYEYDMWQVLVTILETWIYYGSFVHLHFSSSITPIYRLLRVYEKAGEIEMTKWPRMEFQEGLYNVPKLRLNRTYKPWEDVDGHNHNIVLNHCLLNYKVAAKHVAFFDVDDYFVTPIETMSLSDYFSGLFAMHPLTSAFIYPMVYSQFDMENDPARFTIDGYLGTQRHLRPRCVGKWVADPRKVETLWIHQPVRNAGMNRQMHIPMQKHFSMHLRYNTFMNTTAYHSTREVEEEMHIEKAPFRMYPTQRIQKAIAENFERRRKANPDFERIYSQLPLRKCKPDGTCKSALFTNTTSTCWSAVAVAEYRTYWFTLAPIERRVHFVVNPRVVEKRCEFKDV